jgi:acyl-coenzyme A thioesterase PaaI-like protein
VDSACGYAALTLMEPGTGVVSVEFKVQLLAPAAGRTFRASGRVVRAGRTLTVVAGELRAWDAPEAVGDPEGTVVAMLTGTMMTVRGRPGLVD